jgi:23S rRNA (cytosine1962-C5)-methyltransferase
MTHRATPGSSLAQDAASWRSREALFPSFRPAWILHEDEDIIVVDKPGPLATHPPEPDRIDDAHSRLGAFLAARAGSQADRAPYLGIHQRLDKGTSGVLLFSRRKSANAALARQFEGRTVEKTYIAAVGGIDLDKSGVLRHRVAPGEGGAMRVVTGRAAGQEAVARFRVLERFEGRALVEVRPETGRTHQIRVQLAAVGRPIAGDRLYGGLPCERMLLHAAELSLRHPGTGRKVTFRAELPEAFGRWMRGDVSLGGAERVERALRAAADARYGVAWAEHTTALRIANGAGDGLAGVSVDVYGDHLVVALSSDEASACREVILDAAFALGPRGVYVKVRPKHASVVVDTRRDDIAPAHAVRGDDAPDELTIHELGVPYLVRLGDGLSTGIFLDQRENRRRVRALAAGARVLNLFAYTGAFSVAAAVGGARSSVSVDVSRGALAWARRNLDAVGADPSRHETIEADAFAYLERVAAKTQFDLVLLDPPSFATTKTTRFSAASDYRALAAAAMRAVAPGGRLLACTNHKGIVRAKLRRYLHEALRDARREAVQMKDLPDPLDFPAEPGAEPHLKSILIHLK